MASTPTLSTRRLTLDAFTDSDIPALAAILAEPAVTKNITANGSTPERCLASAQTRIGWHNKAWEHGGYGVWAVRPRDATVAQADTLLGWCGFAEPDIGDDPEILYGLAPAHWGRGLAREAATAAIDWLFAETAYSGVSAVIFERLNPVSVHIVKTLGMTQRGTMSMPDFLPDRVLARDVLDYEIWRLGQGHSHDPGTLLFEAPFKGGQIATLGLDDVDQIEQAFCDAAEARADYAALDPATRDGRVREAFRQGMAEPQLAWYHLGRSDWAP